MARGGLRVLQVNVEGGAEGMRQQDEAGVTGRHGVLACRFKMVDSEVILALMDKQESELSVQRDERVEEENGRGKNIGECLNSGETPLDERAGFGVVAVGSGMQAAKSSFTK